MITEDYCSYEIAKMLKEKGFDVYTSTRYDYDGSFHFHGDYLVGDSDISAPTHQMAMKWLREEKYVPIFIVPAKDENGNLTYCADVWTWNDDEGIYEPTWAYANHVYEKAVEAALKYSLENLI